MMRVWLAAALALGACASLVRAAEPATPPSCAILSGTGNRAPDAAVRAVLEARLFAEPGLRFVEREEVARVVQEHNLASAEWSASASRVKLGSILPADALVFIQGLSAGSNSQTRIDVTESRTGVMLGSWIAANAGILAAPEKIIARIRGGAEKSRIPMEARYLIGLLDFRGEESGLAMEGAAAALSELTIPALNRIPNVLVLDREHIEHLQTERDLTTMEEKLRPSVVLLEGGLRGGGTTNEYAITVQLRRLGGGGVTNRVVVAPRADLVAARDRIAEAVSAMLGTVPAGTASVSRAEEAAAFSRQNRLWDEWGDHSRAIRAAEAAFGIDPSQANRLRLAQTLFQKAEAPLERVLRAKQLELDYYRVQMAAIAQGKEAEMILPVLWLRSQSVTPGPQADLSREILRLDTAGFRLRLQHYADHYDVCESAYWATWARRLTEDPQILKEVIEAFGNPPARTERFPVGRLLVLGHRFTGVKAELAEQMIRHPHPFIRLVGHAFRERNLRTPEAMEMALESRHAIFQILTDEVPATHPYRQHTEDGRPWLAVDQWLAWFLPVDPLDKWPVAVPKSARERDIADKVRYVDSLVRSGEPARVFVIGDRQHQYNETPYALFYEEQPSPLFTWLEEIAASGRHSDAYRLAVGSWKLTKEQTLPSSWQGMRTDSSIGLQAPWADRLAAEAQRFRSMVGAAGGQTAEGSALPDLNVEGLTNRSARTKFDVGVFADSRPTPVDSANPQSVWDEYEYHRIPLSASLQGDPIAFVDGNRVCVVRRCGESDHQPGVGVHVYVFWAGSGVLLAERHAAAPVQPYAALQAKPEVYSVVLAKDTAYVGLSSGLLCVPLKGGEPRLLTAQTGLPGNVVKAVGWYGGLVYLSLTGEGGVLASWDPVSNRFGVLASEKAVSPKNMLDGTRFDMDSLIGDPLNSCIWLGGKGTEASGYLRAGIWRFDPATRVVTKVVAPPRTHPLLPVSLAVDRSVSSSGGGKGVFIPERGLWFDVSYHSEGHSIAFDGTNAIDVMLKVYSGAIRTCFVRRSGKPVVFTALPDGTAFPELVSVHETASGVLAILDDGEVALIRRKDMKPTYLDAECQAVSGNPDESRLLRTAARGDVDELRHLLDAGARVETTDGEGKTALMYAAREAKSAAAEFLLDRGAKARAASIGGISVLAYAAQGGDTGTAVRLLQMGADPSGGSRVGRSPLLYAAEAGHADMVKLLLARGANRDATDSEGWNALHLAIERQSVPVVECLLRSGMSPDSPGWQQTPPLVLAGERDSMEIVRLLCKADANTGVVVPARTYNETALPLLAKAAWAGQTNLVMELLQAGAKTEVADDHGNTPLIYAAIAGRFEIVKILLDAGANIEAENKWGCRPLAIAVYEQHPDVVRVLVERKAYVNDQDEEGATPLHHASSTKQWEIVKLLLDHGADPKIKNKKGEPAMVQEK